MLPLPYLYRAAAGALGALPPSLARVMPRTWALPLPSELWQRPRLPPPARRGARRAGPAPALPLPPAPGGCGGGRAPGPPPSGGRAGDAGPGVGIGVEAGPGGGGGEALGGGSAPTARPRSQAGGPVGLSPFRFRFSLRSQPQPGTSRLSSARPRAQHIPARLGTSRLGSAMPRFSVAEARRCGEQFVQFLRDTGREQENRRDALRTIYGGEFRAR